MQSWLRRSSLKSLNDLTQGAYMSWQLAINCPLFWHCASLTQGNLAFTKLCIHTRSKRIRYFQLPNSDFTNGVNSVMPVSCVVIVKGPWSYNFRDPPWVNNPKLNSVEKLLTICLGANNIQNVRRPVSQWFQDPSIVPLSQSQSWLPIHRISLLKAATLQMWFKETQCKCNLMSVPAISIHDNFLSNLKCQTSNLLK